MKKQLFNILAVLLITFFAVPSSAAAQEMVGGCTSLGQCVSNKKCIESTRVTWEGQVRVISPTGAGCGSSQIGGVTPPTSVRRFSAYYFGNFEGTIGLVSFMSILLNLFAVICGIWTMFNFLYSGWLLVTAQSDTKAQSEVKDRLTMTAIGLVIITSSYMVAGVIGLIFFKDPTYILNPTLQGALSTSTTP